jgi:beta-lactamase regulating signal transducer with metallopeptidase domain/biopolymer transport protein ExbD
MIDVLNECGRIWLEPFGLMAVQNTLFLILVFGVLIWLRQAPARLRHLVALVGLVKLVLPPFLPTHVSTSETYVELPALATLPLQSIPGPASSVTVESFPLTLAGLLFGLWTAIAATILGRSIVATLALRFALRGATLATDPDSRTWAKDTGIAVRVSERVPVPMTLGLFPRTVFVPSLWADWSSASRNAVLRHEMAHIHRRDGLVHLLETVVRALYWFHPLALLLTRLLESYREQACDEAAASPDRAGRVTYSRILVEIAEHLLHGGPLRGSASALMRRRNELLDRVHYLTKGESTMSLSKTRAALLTVVLAVGILSLSWYRGEATPPPPPKGEGGVAMKLTVDGDIVVGGESASLENLDEVLGIKTDGGEAIITISCDDDVPMQTLFQVHAVLRASDLYRVRYIGLDVPPMPLELPSEKLIAMAKSLPEEHVVHLHVAAGDECTLDGKKLKPSEIQEAVATRIAKDEHLVVSLQMASDATYGQYVGTLMSLKAAQANRILINEPGAM